MIFESLNIISFGKLTGRKLDLADGVNLIEGDNESGKSTIGAFIRFMFYGLPKEPDERARVISWHDSRAAGTLTFTDGGKRYRIEREAVCVTTDGKTAYREKCTVYDTGSGLAVLRGQSPGEHFFGVSDLVFASTVYIRQTADTKVGGRDLGEEAENILFSGNESINIKKAIAKLDSARVFLFHKNKRGGKIFDLEASRDEISEKLEAAKKASGDIISLEGTARQIAEKREEAEDQLKSVQDELARYECYTLKKAYEKRRAEKLRLAETNAKIDALTSPTEHGGHNIADDGYIASLEKLQNELELSASRYADAETELAGANHKITDMSEKLAIFDKFGAKGGRKREELVSRVREMRRSRSQFVAFGIISFAAALIFATIFSVIFFGLYEISNALKYIALGFTPLFALLGIITLAKGKSLAGNILTICSKFGCADYREFEELVHAAAEDEAYMVFITGARDEAGEKFENASEKLESLSAKILDTLKSNGFLISENTAASLSEAIEKCRDARTELIRLESARETIASRITELEDILTVYPKEFLRSACLDTYDEEAMAAFRLTDKKRDSEFLTKAIASQTERLHQIEVELSALTATAVDPTALAESKASIEAEIAALTEKWDAYMLAIDSLEKAGGKLREGISPKIAKSAAKVMTAFTDGKYTDVAVDTDFGMTFSDGDMMRDISSLSAGTGDLAYISLRIALIELLYQKSVPPFLFDESFSRIDDERLTKVLSLIKKYSERHFQSILFTCHKRERTLMESVGSCHILSI